MHPAGNQHLQRVLHMQEKMGQGSAVIMKPQEMSVKELKSAIREMGLENRAKGMTVKKELVDLLLGSANSSVIL
ncbi:hypothetical protein TrLO_g12198 [Triparma laevis f. longispina]|uniref:Uncharacterized protein n=1 Tax=Triparma laevis f. longispina TaxID=1714387 RepID=A0A9W6ZNU6_9STRA|nr:hypothetical protein TrLO_g12198 [Triparma laevis f. longispina]